MLSLSPTTSNKTTYPRELLVHPISSGRFSCKLAMTERDVIPPQYPYTLCIPYTASCSDHEKGVLQKYLQQRDWWSISHCNTIVEQVIFILYVLLQFALSSIHISASSVPWPQLLTVSFNQSIHLFLVFYLVLSLGKLVYKSHGDLHLPPLSKHCIYYENTHQ